ncbi:MAG: hypothetical protein INF52_15495 [Rhodobacter sp.]|nr:hypothetical protein [Rhodobacter sp.]
MTGRTAHVRVPQPHPGLFAVCNGRIGGQRFAGGPNRVGDGALRRFMPCAAIHHQNMARTPAACGHG